MKTHRTRPIATLAFAVISLAATPVAVQTSYDLGGSDTEIKTPDTTPYVGLAAADRSPGAAATPSAVQTSYKSGASDTEIKAPDITPYVGLAAAGRLPGAAATPSAVQTSYDPGASNTEIKIGNIMPYTGPAAAYGLIGKAIAAYFKKFNAEGGINGRKITFISYDDSYNPAKATEAARKLVEDDRVLLVFQSLGTPSNSAI